MSSLIKHCVIKSVFIILLRLANIRDCIYPRLSKSTKQIEVQCFCNYWFGQASGLSEIGLTLLVLLPKKCLIYHVLKKTFPMTL